MAINKVFIAEPETEKYALNISPSILLKNWIVEYTFTPLYSWGLNRISWSVNGQAEQSRKINEKFKVTVKDEGMYKVTAKWYNKD